MNDTTITSLEERIRVLSDRHLALYRSMPSEKNDQRLYTMSQRITRMKQDYQKLTGYRYEDRAIKDIQVVRDTDGFAI